MSAILQAPDACLFKRHSSIPSSPDFAAHKSWIGNPDYACVLMLSCYSTLLVIVIVTDEKKCLHGDGRAHMDELRVHRAYQ